MTPDPKGGVPERARPRLVVEAETGALLPGVDAVIPRPQDGAENDAARTGGIVWQWSPGQSLPDGACLCAAVGGVEAAAEIARERPGLRVVPRAEVRRGESRYAFARASPGEGFSTYRLDPASVAEFLVVEGGHETRLADWLERAAGLGFDEVWLHGIDAAGARRGFPIEVLRKARKLAPDMVVWLSGGGCELRHFERLASEEGLAAVVAPEADMAGLDPDAVVAALTPPQPAEEAPAL